MAFAIYPEYEFFTGVNVKLYLGGNEEYVIELSKIGEHFQSLSITEGSATEGGNQLQTASHDGGVVSGTLNIYDEDNSIFRALMVTKAPNGNPLQNKLYIELKTYTGPRIYKECLVTDWNVQFSGGVPTISFTWRSICGSNQNAQSNTNAQSYKELEITKKFVKDGVSDFGEFKKAFREVFTDAYTFKYATSKVLEENQLQEIGDDGKIIYYKDDKQESYTITIPDSIKEESGDEKKRFRMNIEPSGDVDSLIRIIMDRFVHAVNCEGDVKISWKMLYGNVIFIYAFNDYGQMIIPQPEGTTEYLDETVFVYNSSLTQGQKYKTPTGEEKRVFLIENISANFSSNGTIIANFQDQANANNPNGNLVLTSRGMITIPSGMPQAIAESIARLSSLTISADFTVSITVYNFIQFYVLGETCVNLIVFDHLGQIHPLTGRMRVDGYRYSLGDGGVIKADVKLKPVFTNVAQDFANSSTGQSSNPSTNTTSNAPVTYPTNPNTSGTGLNTQLSSQSAVDYSST